MQLIFLGTSAGRPTKSRNVTSIAMTLPKPACGFWLIDAGEGTQHRLLESGLKLNKLERILITHMHGDHIYGLPGLLTSRSYFEGAGPLQLIGPRGIKAYLDSVFQLSGAYLEYPLHIVEIDGPGLVAEDERFTIEAAELEHRLLSYGYRISERQHAAPLLPEKLKELGVPKGPLFGRLKRGQDVTLEDGRIVRSSEVVGEPLAGRVVTVLGDTRPCANALQLAAHADLLVHEATFAEGMEEKAAKYGHSTSRQAAETALSAGVRKLAMTHFSSRFDDEAVQSLVAEASAIFPHTVAASDYMRLDVPRPSE